MQVEFRTASSFLVAYSVNLSRGGMFLETEHPAEVGSLITLHFAVPGADPITVVGRVTWRRPAQQDQEPPGIGIEFQHMDDELGAVIDGLVAAYSGLHVLLLSTRAKNRDALTRMVRSVLTTAQVTAAPSVHRAETLLTSSVDAAIIEIDAPTQEALRVVRKAKHNQPPIPVLAIASSSNARASARAAGADEVLSSPPPFDDLRTKLVRALGRPVNVR